MKSVTQKKYSPQKIYQSKLDPLQFTSLKQNHIPQVEDEFRRYSEFPMACQSNIKKQSTESRLTYNKSEHPIVNRMRSVTPASRAKTSYANDIETHYRQLESVLKKQNENFFYQNEFLKQQIKRLYERQAKHKFLIKRYKQQLRLLRMQNTVYQQRYQQIKTYINTVIQKITQITISNEIIEDKDMMRNSSLQLVNKLRQELNLYEELQSQQKLNVNDEKQTKSQQSIQFHQKLCDEDNEQNVTNNFLQLSDEKVTDLNDLQETRYVKEHKKTLPIKKQNQCSLKKPPRPAPPNLTKVFVPNNEKLGLSPHSFEESTPSNSNQNSDAKNTDMCNMKTDNFLLQDTSESNHLNFVNQQIQELTDQSQALMYELKKKGNQDQQIKKKIIRISQKIRQLKMETQTQQFHKFTSLQQIVPKN